MTTNATFRARATHLAAALLDRANLAVDVVDRAADDLTPDIATRTAFIVSEFGSLARVAHRLTEAQRRARAAGDTRPTVLVNGFESDRRATEPVAVMSMTDLARVLGALEDAEGVPA
ncbi:hypothetical protein [Microbacterium testaceum]|uniref:hypothetical protein n=1 Tax=Microbacterium testaceum TaxID=2033 RepID=UPI0037F2EC87